MTENTPALNAAMAKVQKGLPKLERDRTVEVQQKNGGTYSYSYVTLANLSDAILPLLAENGLSFVAMPGAGSDGKMCLRYHLLHESGERLSGEFPISGEGGIQMIGGRITYARRYCLAAIVGVAADEDDESRLSEEGAPRTAQRAAARPNQRTQATAPPAEGKTAQRAQRPASTAAQPPLPGENGAEELATKPQLTKMAILFKERGIEDRDERLAEVVDIIGREVLSASELTKREAHKVIERLTPADEDGGPVYNQHEPRR